MRRFLAFAMCVSGFTLTFSWTRADEPAVAAAAENLPPAPPSRLVARDEPESQEQTADEAAPSAEDRLERIQQERERRMAEKKRALRDDREKKLRIAAAVERAQARGTRGRDAGGYGRGDDT